MAIEDEKEKVDAPDDTRQVILNLLLDGPKTAGQIADKLKIQKSAVRSHLETLRAERSIRSYFRVEGPGRPRKIYELTEGGQELFPRRYDVILSHILQTIETTEGHEYIKKIIRSVADNIAQEIQDKIKNSSADLEESVRILNTVSNEMGFMSSFYKEDNDTYSITSRNCIVHKVAFSNQDTICHGFHDRIIQKALEGKINHEVNLRECIALGDNYSKHVINMKESINKVT